MSDLVLEDHQEHVAGGARGTGVAEVPRSSRATVRNPLLELESARLLQDMPANFSVPLRAHLMALRAVAHERAESCWARRKDRQAVFLRCVAVYAGHLSRLLNTGAVRARRPQGLPSTAEAVAKQATRAFGCPLLLGLPPAPLLMDLAEEARGPLRTVLIELRAAAQLKAQHCWVTRKPPLSSYWKSVAVHAGLFARLLR